MPVPGGEQQTSDVEAGLDSSAPRPPASGRRKWVIAAVAAGVAVFVATGVGVIASLSQPSALQRAGEACSGTKPLDSFIEDLEAESGDDANAAKGGLDEFADLFDGVVAVEDGGQTLLINTKPEDEDTLGVTSLALDCVYGELEVPARVTERIGVTRALDGRQEDTWATS
jgi:hypothetical protein